MDNSWVVETRKDSSAQDQKCCSNRGIMKPKWKRADSLCNVYPVSHETGSKSEVGNPSASKGRSQSCCASTQEETEVGRKRDAVDETDRVKSDIEQNPTTPKQDAESFGVSVFEGSCLSRKQKQVRPKKIKKQVKAHLLVRNING